MRLRQGVRVDDHHKLPISPLLGHRRLAVVLFLQGQEPSNLGFRGQAVGETNVPVSVVTAGNGGAKQNQRKEK